MEHLNLDSFYNWGRDHTPAVRTHSSLESGLYVATVKGTFSLYSAQNWLTPEAPFSTICGTPEPAPTYGSRGGSGEVGFDSEFIFARPWTPTSCAAASLPATWTNFQMKAGGGVGWHHPTVLASHTPTAPSPGHRYEYAVIGHSGRRLAFRLVDSPTADNYGSLRISVRPARDGDCAHLKFRAFHLASEAACLARVAGSASSA